MMAIVSAVLYIAFCAGLSSSQLCVIWPSVLPGHNLLLEIRRSMGEVRCMPHEVHMSFCCCSSALPELNASHTCWLRCTSLLQWYSVHCESCHHASCQCLGFSSWRQQANCV
jgi:hypothetical protein